MREGVRRAGRSIARPAASAGLLALTATVVHSDRRVTVPRAFLARFAGSPSPPSEPRERRVAASVDSRRAEDVGPHSERAPPDSGDVSAPTRGRFGRLHRCPKSSSTTWTRDPGRAPRARSPTARSTSGSSRSSSPRATATRLYVRAPDHVRTLRRGALPAGLAAPRRRGRSAPARDASRSSTRRPRSRRPDAGGPRAERRATARTSPQPELHLRPVRDRRRQPPRPRRRARRRRAARPGLQPAASSTARPASARPTCSTRSATTCAPTATALTVRYATVEMFTSEFVARRARRRRLDAFQRALPRRRRPAHRRRPVPRRAR